MILSVIGNRRGRAPTVSPAPPLVARLRGRLAGLNGVIAFVSWISVMLVIPGMILPGMTSVFVDSVLIRGYDD